METSEQLRNLIGQFYEPEKARQMASEIEQAERRIADFPSPQLRPERLQAIKNQCARELRSKRTHYWQIASAVAACLLAASALLLFRTHRGVSHETSPVLANAERTWQEVMADDEQFIAEVSDELDSISDQLIELQTAQWDLPAPWQQDLWELEDSIIGTSFWKG